MQIGSREDGEIVDSLAQSLAEDKRLEVRDYRLPLGVVRVRYDVQWRFWGQEAMVRRDTVVRQDRDWRDHRNAERGISGRTEDREKEDIKERGIDK